MMLIGNDIVEINRFNDLCKKEHFLDKYFTLSEKNKVLSSGKPAEKLAGMFAIKEAVLKAFGLGIGNGIDLKDVVIEYTSLGQPAIKQTPKISDFLMKNNLTEIKVSVSHTDSLASAVCVII